MLRDRQAPTVATCIVADHPHVIVARALLSEAEAIHDEASLSSADRALAGRLVEALRAGVEGLQGRLERELVRDPHGDAAGVQIDKQLAYAESRNALRGCHATHELLLLLCGEDSCAGEQ